MNRSSVAAAAAVTVLVGAGGVWVAAGRAAQDAPKSSSQPTTAAVQRTTLVDGETADGVLGHGDTTALPARATGTLTWLPSPGARVLRGQTVYRLDEDPVVLLYGALPAYRPLTSGTEGKDVEQLERNLQVLGYTGFTVDDTYTSYTADAVREWQEDLGVTETGSVEPARIVIAPGPVRVDSVDTELGALVAEGTPVLSQTGVRQLVTLDIDPAERRFAKRGTRVQVIFPDGTTVPGRVRQAETVVEPGESAETEDDTTKVVVTVGLPGRRAQRLADRYDSAAVDVTFTVARRRDVLGVPVAALVALAEGGHGVEIVDDGTTRVVAVETGMFAQGLVEVSGTSIREGTKVVIPS